MTQTAVAPISLRAADRDMSAFARDLGESFARTGFAVIADHGIDRKIIADAFDRTRSFFALPDEIKRRYIVPAGKGQRGYTAFGIETAKGAARADLKEFWHVGRELPAGHPLRTSTPANLQLLCAPCNRDKGAGLG